MPPSETIGERLCRIREEHGLTQRDISAPGVSPQYVSKVERGERTPSVKALRRLATNLGVSAQFLETGHDLAEAEVRDFRLDDADLALRLGAEDPATTEATLLAIMDEAAGAGDTRAATRARLNLGAVASRCGEHELAISRLEPAIRERWVTPSSHADAFATLGHSYVAVGRGELAAALFRECLDDVETRQPFSAAAAARFATYLSYVLVDIGAYGEAREALEVALRHGRGSDDPYTTIRLHWSSARLAASAGELDVAQQSVNRAIGLLEATEDTAHLARAHLLGAEISLWDGDYAGTADHLEAAGKLLPESAELEDRVFLLIQRAFLAARTDEAAAAMDYANDAIGMLGNHDDETIRGRAEWALAEAFAAAGATTSARAAFKQASERIPPGSKHAARLLEAWQRAVPTEVG